MLLLCIDNKKSEGTKTGVCVSRVFKIVFANTVTYYNM